MVTVKSWSFHDSLENALCRCQRLYQLSSQAWTFVRETMVPRPKSHRRAHHRLTLFLVDDKGEEIDLGDLGMFDKEMASQQ